MSELGGAPVERPRFEPSLCDVHEPSLEFGHGSDADILATWVPLLSCSAGFPAELFETAVEQLIHHPEYNSTLILRSETQEESTSLFPPPIPALRDMCPARTLRRTLLPRRPGRDAPLQQCCTLYTPSEASHPTLLVLTPLPEPGTPLPYYHPAVTHLALEHLPTSPPTLRISAVPLPGTPTDPDSRLARTARALLETLHRYGWGARTAYRKRMAHDRLVAREAYQDLYLVLRERHKHLVQDWQEATDPLKHVYEDIGIATYLMLLWKDTFRGHVPLNVNEDLSDNRPWMNWPRPPGGFLDLGCGNGLLVHILIAEGYTGCGIDVRARRSWATYPPATRAALHVYSLDPTAPSPPLLQGTKTVESEAPITPWSDETMSTPSGPSISAQEGTGLPSDLPTTALASGATAIGPGAFLIGNHADELTPWVPVLATRWRASGFLSIPCCAWSFDARYERSRAGSGGGGGAFDFLLDEALGTVSHDSEESHGRQDERAKKDAARAARAAEDAFVESLGLGGEARGSAYAQYRVWLSRAAGACGWVLECDALRIPSTRNWALVGRTRTEKLDEVDGRTERLVRVVQERGLFRTRRPEGKAGDH